ncbi:MAG: 4Fe-4S dicluster domain-containing protein [Planctomycetota bacterium]
MNVKRMAILTDVTRCIGCEECVRACKGTNATGKDKPWRWQESIDSLSAARWTTIRARPPGRSVRQQCRHCLSPACVSACPVAALRKTAEGAVTYRSDICMGCRYCMMACPFQIPRYEWDSAVPRVRKCTLCHEHIFAGRLLEPACTKACPADATKFGERDALLSEARERIRANPKRYVDRIWGEHEYGGTSVMYVSDVDLGFLAWKDEPGGAALPDLTKPALLSVPPVFLGVGAVLYGTWWVIERRMRLQKEQPKEGAPPPEGGGA